ncbi:efflux transporter outer membrane subunit [Chitinibacter bivalviorum]|uniref:Efflux transporter outer membrane subunit n=1 Tax=Chitinibacter bivalviorum TaxID=2739434 RepID=A0A7H9BGC1_9NEIS|nr:efflux transporter outer membrane subunit [Chitinibacter bivalviorum]QLG87472.1 efflux transporter outer membrane subunit [Chitinibacter bivalviorum]
MNMRKTILSLSIATLLSACAFTPDNTLPTVEIPAVATQADAVAIENWWSQFNDPILNQLIEYALINNQNLALATAKVDEARAVLGIVSSDQLPKLGLGADAGTQKFSKEGGTAPGSTVSDYKLVGQASWEIDLWGRIRNLSTAAKQDLLATEFNREGVKLTLTAEVAQNYFNLRALDAQLIITDETIKSRQEAYDLREKRFKGGITSELDVRQAQAELAAAQAKKPDLEISIAKTEGALSVLVGQSPRALVESGVSRGLTIDQLTTPPVIPAGLDSSLLLRRPDIAQAEAGLLAARARIQSARAAYFPRLSLTGLLGLESLDFSRLFQGSAQTWAFAGNLTMPLFDGGLTASQIDQAKARDRQAAAIYQQAIQNAFVDTRNVLVANKVINDRVAAEQTQVTSTQRQLKLATLRYDNGFASYLEVLDAQRNLFSSQLQLVSAQRDLLDARVSLYKALGGGWSKN